METTNEKISAREYYLKLDEKPYFTQLTKTGISDNLHNVFRFADEYHRDQSKSQTTSQQQTIERLREIVKRYIDDRKGVAGLTPVGTDMYNDLHNEIKEAEQLLSTTEPIDQ